MFKVKFPTKRIFFSILRQSNGMALFHNLFIERPLYIFGLGKSNSKAANKIA